MKMISERDLHNCVKYLNAFSRTPSKTTREVNDRRLASLIAGRLERKIGRDGQ